MPYKKENSIEKEKILIFMKGCAKVEEWSTDLFEKFSFNLNTSVTNDPTCTVIFLIINDVDVTESVYVHV